MLIEGESGLLACSPPWRAPLYQPTKRRVTWPNGTIATTYFGRIAPEQLRGPQHHYAWCDELAKWRYAQEAWDNLELGLRLGTHPQVIATTTPRPIPLLRQLLADPGTVVTRGSTYENTVNLAATFRARVLRPLRRDAPGTPRGAPCRTLRRHAWGSLDSDTPGADTGAHPAGLAADCGRGSIQGRTPGLSWRPWGTMGTAMCWQTCR